MELDYGLNRRGNWRKKEEEKVLLPIFRGWSNWV